MSDLLVKLYELPSAEPYILKMKEWTVCLVSAAQASRFRTITMRFTSRSSLRRMTEAAVVSVIS